MIIEYNHFLEFRMILDILIIIYETMSFYFGLNFLFLYWICREKSLFLLQYGLLLYLAAVEFWLLRHFVL